MATIKFIYYKYLEKRSLVSRYLEHKNIYFFNKSEYMDNRFCEVFYSCVTSNISLEIYELFSEISLADKPFYKNIYYMDIENLQKLYKRIAMYYVIKFSSNIKNNNIMKVMIDKLYYIYEFDDYEKNLFEKLNLLNNKDEISFQLSFVKNIFSDVFNTENKSVIALGFIYNFLYTSYNNFIKCYTKYIDIESWIKYA